MMYVFDISCLDTYASGAKQRFLGLYSELIKKNKNKNFLIIYTSFTEVRRYFNYPNVTFKKNKFNQDNYIKKIFSILYIYFFTLLNSKKIRSIEFFTLPFLKIKKCYNIFTIHDLRRIYFSESIFIKFLYKFFFSFFLRSADNIIVVSHSIKKEILSYFNKLKVSVIYNTIDYSSFKKINNKNLIKIKKKYNLPEKFILCVGHLERRKNYIRLIKAINILNQDKEKINLVIVGQKSSETQKIQNIIEELKLKKNIKIFNKLNDFEVRCFYKLSSLFVFPSTYEGFGIPILEAMASKTPMVLSNTDVFREITENKYIYFDQYDPLSIAQNIKLVLGDKKLQKKMINYGNKRIISFTLEKQKKEIHKFYNNL